MKGNNEKMCNIQVKTKTGCKSGQAKVIVMPRKSTVGSSVPADAQQKSARAGKANNRSVTIFVRAPNGGEIQYRAIKLASDIKRKSNDVPSSFANVCKLSLPQMNSKVSKYFNDQTNKCYNNKKLNNECDDSMSLYCDEVLDDSLSDCETSFPDAKKTDVPEGLTDIFPSHQDLTAYLNAEKNYFDKAATEKKMKKATSKSMLYQSSCNNDPLRNLRMLAEVACICSDVNKLVKFDDTHISAVPKRKVTKRQKGGSGHVQIENKQPLSEHNEIPDCSVSKYFIL